MSLSLKHPTALPEAELLAQCDVKRTRASGPGGQHRNKVETAIVVTHLPTGVIGQASEKRSQHANLKAALVRLRKQLAIDVRSTPLLNAPDDRWLDRVKGRQIKVNPAHDDFPVLLAGALDVLEFNQHEISKTAKVLQVSTSQLVKFFRSDSNVWQHVQTHRKSKGLGPLK